MKEWKPFSLQPQIFSIFVVLVILVVILIVYNKKLKKVKPTESPTGFVLLVQIYINFIRNLVVDILGPKLEKLTPIFLFFFSYICFSNMISVFGLENPTSSLTVTLSLAFIVWIGTFVIGFKFQKLSYLKTFFFCFNVKKTTTYKDGIKGVSKIKVPFMLQPLEIISAITPLISLSLRLWGNIFAGSLICLLWQYMTGYIWSKVPVICTINILGGISIVPIHLYFDILCGLIQSLVFTLLAIVYWNMAKGEQDVENALNANMISEKRIMNWSSNVNNLHSAK